VLKLQSRQDLAFAIGRLHTKAQPAWDKREDAYNSGGTKKRNYDDRTQTILAAASQEDIAAFHASEEAMAHTKGIIAVLKKSREIAAEQESNADQALYDAISKLKWVQAWVKKSGPYPGNDLGKAGSSLAGVSPDKIGALLEAKEHEVMQLAAEPSFELDEPLKWLLQVLIEATSPAASRVQILADLRTEQASLCSNTCEVLRLWVELRRDWQACIQNFNRDIAKAKSHDARMNTEHDALINKIDAANQARTDAEAAAIQQAKAQEAESKAQAEAEAQRKAEEKRGKKAAKKAAKKGKVEPDHLTVNPVYVAGDQPMAGSTHYQVAGGQAPTHYQVAGGQVPTHYQVAGGQAPTHYQVAGGQAPTHYQVAGGQAPAHYQVAGGQAPTHYQVAGGQVPAHYQVAGGQAPAHYQVAGGQTGHRSRPTPSAWEPEVRRDGYELMAGGYSDDSD